MRDVRVLSENLLGTDDWNRAGHEYADARDRYFKTVTTVADWFFDLFFARGPGADVRRERAFPLIMTEPDRIPDHVFSGPDLPCDERVNHRFFGEI
jgi:hypothetical protein